MTHADVSVDQKQAMGITEKMIRLSVGVENSDDIIWDLEQALSQA
jgi:methionine-gamma-lyase